jgi:hypothetical protein
MGPYLFAEGNQDYSGYQQRVMLACRSVNHVSSFWREAWPDDDTISRILADVHGLLQEPCKSIAERESMDSQVQELWAKVTELTDESRDTRGIVGMAAVSLLSLALWDGFMVEDDIDLERQDSDDFMLNDVHFYAAAAYAGGPPYGIALAGSADDERRLEFWSWWLNTAVPDVVR